MKYSLLSILILFAISIFKCKKKAVGQSNQNDILHINKTKDFAITGNGAASNWKKTNWINIRQRTKQSKSQVLTTRAKVLYSNTGIYFLFECQDRVLNSTMHSDFMHLWKEDVVEVFLWPNESEPAYLEYELSPLNHELPLLVSNLNGSLTRWRPYMYEGNRKTRHMTRVQGGVKKSKARISQWTAEFFIPFKLLRPLNNISPTRGTKWKANLYRIDYDSNQQRDYEWKPVKNSFHEIDKFGTLHFQ